MLVDSVSVYVERRIWLIIWVIFLLVIELVCFGFINELNLFGICVLLMLSYDS